MRIFYLNKKISSKVATYYEFSQTQITSRITSLGNSRQGLKG